MKISSASIIFSSTILAQALGLARSVVVARILGPELFGIAVAILLLAQFLDTLADAGLDKMIIQSKNGNEVLVQGTAHLLSILRGFLLAGILAATIPFAETVYGIEGIALALLIVCLSPLFSGFQNLDYKRVQRFGQFLPEARLNVLGELANFVVAVAIAWKYQSFYAVPAGLVARSLVMMIVSHVDRERKYSVSWNKDIGYQIWLFSWPLLLNGPIVFASTQGDRILVTQQLGLKTLGLYAAMSLLITAPILVVQKVLSSIFFPRLSKEYHLSQTLGIHGRQFIGLLMLAAVALTTGYTVLGPPLIRLLYGEAYDQPGSIVALVAILGCVRLLRSWPATFAFSLGANSNHLYSNLSRLIAFPLALAGLWQIGGFTGLLIGFAAGEWIALILGMLLLRRREGGGYSDDWTTIGIMALMCAANWVIVVSMPQLAGGIAMVCLSAAVAIFLFVRFQLVDMIKAGVNNHD